MRPGFRLYLLGLLAFILALSTLAAAWFLFPRPSFQPSDLVPAKRTVAFAEHVTVKEKHILLSMMPWVTEIPLEQEPVTIALLTADDGTVGWILFRATGEERMEASDPALLSLLRSAPSLTSDPLFVSLRPSIQRSTPWAFVRAAPAPLLLPAFAVSIAKNRTEISLPIAPRNPSMTLQTAATAAFERPAYVVQNANLEELLAAFSSKVDENRLPALRTLLQGWLTERLGKDFSLTYDVLPALGKGAVALSVSQEGVWLLEGEGDDTEKLRNLLPVLHASFAKSFPNVIRTERSFDKRFPYVGVRLGKTVETTKNTGGWEVRTTTQESSSGGLFSALRGGRFILTNHLQVLDKARTALPRSLDLSESHVMARGTLMKESILSGTLREWIPPAFLPLLSRGSGSTVTLRLRQLTDSLTLSIEE